MENPFATIDARLSNIEALLLDLSNNRATQDSSACFGAEKPLTIKEASDLVNLAVPTLYSMVSQAAIPHSKKGKRLYFSKQELLEWVNSGRRPTQDEIQAEALAELAIAGRRAR